MLLERIESPADLKALPADQLNEIGDDGAHLSDSTSCLRTSATGVASQPCGVMSSSSRARQHVASRLLSPTLTRATVTVPLGEANRSRGFLPNASNMLGKNPPLFSLASCSHRDIMQHVPFHPQSYR